jgi:hypothetical protein
MFNKFYIIVLALTLSIVFGNKLFSQSGSQTFTSSGTFTVPANVTSITIELVGAGGSGGGNGGGGGGGGGFASGVYTVVALSDYTVTVGTAGGGVTGGTTGVGSLISATGGENGTWVPNPNLGGGGAGGIGTNGTIVNRTGGTGGGGYWTYFGGGGGGAAGSVSNGFDGGNTILWTGNCITPGGDGGLSGGTPGGAGGKGAGFTDSNCNITNPAGNGENYGGGGGGGNGNGGIPGTGTGGYVLISWGIVPVELSLFTAETIKDGIVLKWQTATETNNQGFEIKRSLDNISFNIIGFVPGFGTTTEPKNYSYSDQSVKSGTNYYRLKQIDYDGSYAYSDVLDVDFKALNTYILEQNYPNPFNPTTVIGFSVQNKSNVRITILSPIGEEVAVLLNEEIEPGFHQVEFSAKGGSASGGNAYNLPSGVYFYQLRTGDFVETKKMVLMK